MKFAAYIRTATQNPASVEKQRTEIAQWIITQNGDLVETYIDESSSGRNQERPALHQMQADAAQGRFEAVVVTDLHRLSRNQTELDAIRSRLQIGSVEAYSIEELATTPVAQATK